MPELPVEDDAELIERYLNGDRMAASLLVARHSASLFGWLRWKTGGNEDAEDLAQIVWAQAFAALPRLHERRAFRAWLFTLCRHAFAHWLRERRATCSLDAPGENFAGLLAAPSGALEAVEDRLALRNALLGLSEEHRDTFLLRYVSQFSAPEIAQILDIPVGTVESRCHFARARLRQWFVQSEMQAQIVLEAQAQSEHANALQAPSGLHHDSTRQNLKSKRAKTSSVEPMDAKPALFGITAAGLKAKKHRNTSNRGLMK